MGTVEVFVAVKVGTLLVPFAGKPIAVLLFVHAKVPTLGILTNVVAETLPALQTLMFEGTVTVGKALIVIVSVATTIGQLPAAAMVYDTM